MLSTVLEYAVILGVMTGLAVLMGKWLARVFSGRGHALPERATYRLLGIDPGEVDFAGHVVDLTKVKNDMFVIAGAMGKCGCGRRRALCLQRTRR